ncbi:MAG: protein kinase domain-containing protein [Thermoplasmatota archaeon]
MNEVEADDNLPAELTVTVTDNYGAADDMMTYEGDDVYFALLGWGTTIGSWDYSVQITINDENSFDMVYYEINDVFNFTLADVSPGEYFWNITAVNNTDLDARYMTGSLIVLEYPSFGNIGGPYLEFEEDQFIEKDFKDYFTGVDNVYIDNLTELEADGWTFDDLGNGSYNISQAENANGVWEFILRGTSDYAGLSVYGPLMVTVAPVNDAPVIIGIEFQGMTFVPEEINITLAWDNVTGDATEWIIKRIIELPFEEDGGPYNFTVIAQDVETPSSDLSYNIVKNDGTESYTIDSNDLSSPMNFTFNAPMNVYGTWEATLTVSDGDDQTEELIWFDVENVNDSPFGSFTNVAVGDILERKVGVELNVSVTVSDPEGDDLTVDWFINGESVANWNKEYLVRNWSSPGIYNVSVNVNDGVMLFNIGYFHVNVTFDNTAPVIDAVTVDKLQIHAGEVFNLTVEYTDGESNVDKVAWRVDTASGWYAEGDTVLVDYSLPSGKHVFTVTLTDAGGLTAEDSITITILEPTPNDDDGEDGEGSSILPLVIILIIILVIIMILVLPGIIILFVVRRKQGKDRADVEIEAGSESWESEEEVEESWGEAPEEEPADIESGVEPVIETPMPEFKAPKKEKAPVKEEVPLSKPPSRSDQERERKIARAEGLEFAMNFDKAAEIYEELEMWGKARECRQMSKGGEDAEESTVEVDTKAIKGYSMISRIGKGGFAEVYLAKDREGNQVAIKRPNDEVFEVGDTMKIRKKFLREAENWDKLLTNREARNGVVEILGYDLEPEPHIIMEYMDEGNLRQAIKKMTFEEKKECLLSILDTLHVVHHLGMIHRDIKPENILRNSKGQWKITDWGLSKVLLDTSGTLTKEGMIKATLSYAAPEQVDQDKFGKVDWRTDIYQVGALAYELFTGKHPFEGPASKVMYAIVSKYPDPPASVSKRISQSLSDVIMKALQKEKSDRYQSSSEFRIALSSSK